MSSSGYFRFPAINTGEKGATVGSRRSEIPNLPLSFDLHPEHRDLASGSFSCFCATKKSSVSIFPDLSPKANQTVTLIWTSTF